MSQITSWWHSHEARVRVTLISGTQINHEAAALLKQGFALMASGMLMMGAAYAVRTIVLRMHGFDAAGFYSAAWTLLGGGYAGIILQAVGADFFPRLVGVAQDNPRCNRLVNEQAQLRLFSAGPGGDRRPHFCSTGYHSVL